MAKSNDKTALFESMPVSKAVWTLCIPNILSMLTGVIYNMVDIYFIGKTNDPYQVAAVSLCGPIFTILMGIGNIFGIGGSSLLSRSMGEGKKDLVKRIASFAFWTSIAIGLICSVIILGGMSPLLKVLGASKDTWDFCKQYLMWVGFGAAAIVMNYVLSNLVRAEGKARETMIGMMMGTICNVILDPIMIFGLHMGVVGAAAATVLSNLIADIYFALLVCFKSDTQSISPKIYKANKEVVAPILVIGIPASLNNVMTSIATILLNNKLGAYGDNAVAGLGIASKVNTMGMLILVAIAFGVMPLLGYCYGAKNDKRFNEVLRYTALCQIAVGSFATLLLEVFAPGLVRIFIKDTNVIGYGVYILRIMNISGPVVGLLFLVTNLFQSMGKGVPSMILSLSRQGIVYIPMLMILSAVFGYYGVVWAQPIADYVALAIGVAMYIGIRKKDKKTA